MNSQTKRHNKNITLTSFDNHPEKVFFYCSFYALKLLHSLSIFFFFIFRSWFHFFFFCATWQELFLLIFIEMRFLSLNCPKYIQGWCSWNHLHYKGFYDPKVYSDKCYSKLRVASTDCGARIPSIGCLLAKSCGIFESHNAVQYKIKSDTFSATLSNNW